MNELEMKIKVIEDKIAELTMKVNTVETELNKLKKAHRNLGVVGVIH